MRLLLFLLRLSTAAVAAVCLHPARAVAGSDMIVDRRDTTSWIFDAEKMRASQAGGPMALPAWIVSCPYEPATCFARSGPLVLQRQSDGRIFIHLAPLPKGCVTVEIRDYAYDLNPLLDRALSPVWIERLSHPLAYMVVEPDCATDPVRRPLIGLGLAIAEIQTRAGVSKATADAPMTAYADAAENARGPQPKLIPDTKPQIQFAIRAQEPGAVDE